MSESEYEKFLALVEKCEELNPPSVGKMFYSAGEGVTVERYIDPRDPRFYIFIVYADGNPIAPSFGFHQEATDAADDEAAVRQEARKAATTETDPVPTEPDTGTPKPRPPGT
jgi:hypothetical protein